MAAKTGIHRLTARQVQTLKADVADGGGLSARFPRKGSGSPCWVFRYTSLDGRRRELGLGAVAQSSAEAAGASLREARDDAARARALLRERIDPIEQSNAERKAAKAEAEAAKRAARAESLTLARVARDYHERVIEPNRTRKHAAQWLQSLETHVPADLWHAPIGTIEPPALLDAVAELQARIPETASRLRQRLEAVFDDAEFRKLCSGNPARAIRRKLRELSRRRERGSFAALPYAEVPSFMAALRKRESITARALEFAVLTAARTGEVIAAKWAEFDPGAGLWVVPADRMKGGETHTAYLSTRALEIVKAMQEFGSVYVFPSPESVGKETPAPLSNMAMLTLLRRMDADKRTTVHGLCRASFSTWANETGAARPDVIEACLAHSEGDKVRRAYNRSQFAIERRALLAAWADYCHGEGLVSNVVPLQRAA
jgi:integrase